MRGYKNDLLSLCARALFNFETDVLITEEIVGEALNQAVFSLISADIPENSSYKSRALNVVAKNILVKNEHLLVHNLMNKNNIPYVILKGSASADYYPEPMLRTAGDVDFLVAPENISKARAVLEAEGFTTEDKDTGLHYCYTKGKSVLELHFSINGIPNNEVGEKLREYFADIFEKSVKNSDGLIVPSHFHHGLIILLHMISHLITGGIGLRHLCDWAAFVSHFSNEEFEAMFKKLLENVGLWKCAKIMTSCSVKFLGAPKKTFAEGIEDTLINDIIEDIFTGGNFGYKQEGREQQIKFIGDRKNLTVDNKSVISQLFTTLNNKTRKILPICAKIPIMLPIGWLLVGGNYIKLSLTGKRSNKNIKSHIKTAQQRKNIYSKIDLFKI